MGNGNLQGLRIAILVTDGFEQVELEKPRAALDDAGGATIVVSPKNKTVLGMNHIDKGDEFVVDQPMDQAEPDEFDAVLLPGGVVNADTLRMNEHARRFVQACDASGKPIAVICHGPWLLVSAGLVKGRQLTSYYTVQDDIRNAGGNWADQETVLDKNWISSRQPSDIPAFNKAMVELFAKAQKKSKQAGQA
ncbi:MAG TPA: type 1 glutamine amidotransferase domain-containing protein [Candidatus Acidoferrum sp.]|jgi:protease I